MKGAKSVEAKLAAIAETLNEQAGEEKAYTLRTPLKEITTTGGIEK